jgi:hypothetical protein
MKHQRANVQIFASSDPNPTFVTDSNCQFIGLVTLQFKDTKGGSDGPSIDLKLFSESTEHQLGYCQGLGKLLKIQVFIKTIS